VSDNFQRKGIGTEMVRLLLAFAREEKLHSLTATVLYENQGMQKVFEKLGFTMKETEDHDALEAQLIL
jgi:acetyltransferase